MKTLQELLDEFKNSELGKIKQNDLETKTIRRKLVYQFNLSGKLLKTWKSGWDLKKNDFPFPTICKGLKSNPITICNGFVWSYSENIDLNDTKGNRKYSLVQIVVTDLHDNILSICNSTKEVSEKYGICSGAVRRVLRGEYKKTNNYKMFFKKNLAV